MSLIMTSNSVLHRIETLKTVSLTFQVIFLKVLLHYAVSIFRHTFRNTYGDDRGLPSHQVSSENLERNEKENTLKKCSERRRNIKKNVVDYDVKINSVLHRIETLKTVSWPFQVIVLKVLPF